jgi:four helix bundle protein
MNAEDLKLKNEKLLANRSLFRYNFPGDDMKENILIEKSINFGARIVKLYRYLTKTKHETILSKQILRSGTSIGANINEAQFGNSKSDFIAKLHIALKETAETEYWLHLLRKSDYLDETISASLLRDCLEIKRILIASLNTAKKPEC